jgi:hypothetical protein
VDITRWTSSCRHPLLESLQQLHRELGRCPPLAQGALGRLALGFFRAGPCLCRNLLLQWSEDEGGGGGFRSEGGQDSPPPLPPLAPQLIPATVIVHVARECALMWQRLVVLRGWSRRCAGGGGAVHSTPPGAMLAIRPLDLANNNHNKSVGGLLNSLFLSKSALRVLSSHHLWLLCGNAYLVSVSRSAFCLCQWVLRCDKCFDPIGSCDGWDGSALLHR